MTPLSVLDLSFVGADSTPAQALHDTLGLARHVDGVLCCARYGRSQLSDTVETVANLRRAGGHVLGIAMTMVRPGTQPTYDVMPLPDPRTAAGAR